MLTSCPISIGSSLFKMDEFIEYAKQISEGKIIYKDFQVFVQPIYVLIFSWLADLFRIFIYFLYLDITDLPKELC